MRVIISAGGTGGHIFPALSVADTLKSKVSAIDILFVGAEGRMEMDLVPKAGYEIKGLWVSGFQRSFSLKNLSFPFKLLSSMSKAAYILLSYKPDFVLGFGGYASGPVLKMASWLGIPYYIQEQNSYAGVTNKLLSKKASAVFVAYPNLERFFPGSKVLFFGNPIRSAIHKSSADAASAKRVLGLDANAKVVFIFGGSLGARTLNEAMQQSHDLILAHPEIHWIWQIGKGNFAAFSESPTAKLPNVRPMSFIDQMALTYAAADLIISRAGALSISEIALLSKAVILVPSPNVAEDHQTKNARALSDHGAAILIDDKSAKDQLITKAIELVHNSSALNSLSEKISDFGKPEAADDIVRYILNQQRI